MATSIDDFSDPPDERRPDLAGELHGDIAEAASPRRRLGTGGAIILVLAALAITVAIGVVRTTGGGAGTVSAPVGATARAAAPTPAATGRVYVDVSGAVRSPGLFVLPGNARVVDAISAAGGFTPKAQREGVNLARPLTDGEQLVVPQVGSSPAAAETPAPAGTSAGGGTAGARVNLNTATQDQLEQLPRIGPALAQRILQWRTDNQRFTSVDDLLAVSGIGDKMLAGLRDLVTV